MAPPDLLLRGTSNRVPSIFLPIAHFIAIQYIMMGRRFMLEVILNFLSNTYVDQNIARQNDWFHTIYYDEPYCNLFLPIDMSENIFNCLYNLYSNTFTSIIHTSFQKGNNTMH